MHKLILNEVIKRCELRYRDGDYPSEPPFSSETLEDAVLALSAEVERLKKALGPSGVTSKMVEESRNFLARFLKKIPSMTMVRGAIEAAFAAMDKKDAQG